MPKQQEDFSQMNVSIPTSVFKRLKKISIDISIPLKRIVPAVVEEWVDKKELELKNAK